jgi:transposase
MNTSYTVGIDIAKHKNYYHLADAQSQCLASAALAADAAGLDALHQQLARHGPPGAFLIVMEATGMLHLPWAEALTELGYRVFVLNPLASKRLCSVDNAIRDRKTDRVDAAGLSEIGRVHAAKLARFVYRSDPKRFGLRRLRTIRQQTRAAFTNLKKSYRSLLGVVFPELTGLVNIHTERVRELLEKAPTPARLLRQPLDQLQRAFGKKTDAVLEALRQTLAPAPLAEASAEAVQAALRGLASLHTQLSLIDLQIAVAMRAVVSEAQIGLIQSVPGFGCKTAAVTVAFLPEEFLCSEAEAKKQGGAPLPRRKKMAARLQALMGNDPREDQSGLRDGAVHMSKRGSVELRTCFYQAAQCAVLHDAEIKRYYERKVKAGKEHKLAISHVMRILARRLIAVLRSGEPYQARVEATA